MATPTTRGGTALQPVRRHDPFGQLEQLHGDLGNLIESMWSGLGAGAVGSPTAWVPPVDVEETEEAWLVEAEVPGVDKKDVEVDLRDNELTISGEIKERVRTGVLRRRTRRLGRFLYRVALPGAVDSDDVDASLRDGVLTVRVGKPERARSRRIDVGS